MTVAPAHRVSPLSGKTPTEKKATRTLIRLRHSLNADEEINVVLPDALRELRAEVLRRGVLEAPGYVP